MIREEQKLRNYRSKIAERNKHIEILFEKIEVIRADITHLTRLNSLYEEKVERLEKKLNQKT
jgi:cupin superfamily acireductone dioxygenase involved in methionine salvage